MNSRDAWPFNRTFGAKRNPGPVLVGRSGREMAWAGIQSFLKLPVCLTPEDLRTGGIDVAVGGVPWDGTATGLAGAHLGPRAIRQSDYLAESPRLRHLEAGVDPFEHLVVCDYGDVDVQIGNPQATYAKIQAFVAEMIAGGAVPVLLGGDHGITWPSVTAVSEAYSAGSIGIVHLDAHADTTPDMQGATYGHGTPIRRLVESGAVPARNIVQIGLRGYLPEPDVLDWMSQQGIRSHFMAEIRRDGFGTVLERALEDIRSCADRVYLSLDIDVADPAYAPGTGTPEPGGLSSWEVMQTARRVAAEVGIVGMDVVEVSPPHDVGPGITALLARRCVMEALTGIAMRRIGLTDSNYLDEPRLLAASTRKRDARRP